MSRRETLLTVRHSGDTQNVVRLTSRSGLTVCRATAHGCTPDDVRLCQADLLHGAKLQLRGALRMKVRLDPEALVAPVLVPLDDHTDLRGLGAAVGWLAHSTLNQDL